MNQVQSFNFGNIAVSFRADGFLNATVIASHFGKQARDYLKTEQTQQYITALAENLSVKTKILTKENQIVIVKRGGSEQGTWLHPKLAVHFARWLDPKFAVWCDEQIEALLNGKVSDGPAAKTTADDRTPLRQAVAALVGRKGIDYSTAYGMVHQRFNVGAIEDIPAGQLPEAVAYVHALTLHTGLVGEVLDAEPAPAPFDDLDVAHLLLHAQDIRLFIRRYLPAFENLGIDKSGALWSYVHDTTPVFNRVRAAVLPRLKDQWLQQQIMKTAGV